MNTVTRSTLNEPWVKVLDAARLLVTENNTKDRIIKTRLIKPNRIVKDFPGWNGNLTRSNGLFAIYNPNTGGVAVELTPFGMGWNIRATAASAHTPNHYWQVLSSNVLRDNGFEYFDQLCRVFLNQPLSVVQEVSDEFTLLQGEEFAVDADTLMWIPLMALGTKPKRESEYGPGLSRREWNNYREDFIDDNLQLLCEWRSQAKTDLIRRFAQEKIIRGRRRKTTLLSDAERACFMRGPFKGTLCQHSTANR